MLVMMLLAPSPEAVAADGGTGLDAQIQRLAHPLWTARVDAAEAIASFGSEGRAAIPALVATIDDTEIRVRRAVVPALAAVGHGSGEAVSGLVLALSDPDWVVRRKAALSFEEVGGGDMAVDAIRPLFGTESTAVQTAAALALAGLAPASRAAVPELAAALSASDWQLRAAAAQALGELGAEAAAALPALAAALRDRDWGVAEQVVEALSQIGAPALPVLVEALADANLPVRWGAARALGRIGAEARPAVDALAGLLEDPAMQARWAAAKSLEAIESDAAAAIPELAAALDDDAWVVRWAAARALGAVAAEPHLDTVADSLAAALRDRDSRVCEAAAFALEQVGPGATAAIDALSAASAHGRGEAPEECQVIDVGPAAEQVLMESGWTVRWAAVRALGVVGAGRAEALSPLTAALDDDQWQVRGVATLAVGGFGELATRPVISDLVEGLDDEHPAVRKATLIALRELGS
ncbi:MAG TPA: HEAT repeat domain-containing protein, partial [Woeseiaceae bacterium]